ncbi:MAG: secretin N-terminal domain-containing protein [Candidatus Aminicenantales bacterium]
MKKIALMLALALTLGGCTTLTHSYRLGVSAELNKQYDMAIKYYEQAAAENPKESVYRLALFRAKAAASLVHLQNARVLAAQGKKKDAATEYGIALFYDPLNRSIAEEMKALEAPPPKPNKPIAEVAEAPVKLKPTVEKLSISFRTPVSLRSIFETLARITGVTFIYDETFRDMSLAVDLTGKDIEQAINYLCIASKNFSRIVDEKTVIVAPDNIQMRQKYELLVIKTIYLSNINAQDVQAPLVQMVKTQYKIPTLGVDKNLNSITIRDTPQVVALAERLLRAWDKPQGEVVIDVEIMEVDRNMLRNLGVDFSNTTMAVQLNPAGGQGSSTGWLRLNALSLKSLASYELSTPQAVIQFLEGDANTKIIAQPRIRGLSGEDMKYLVGQKVPIPQGSFTPIVAGGTNTQPIVSYTQQDVGIDLKMKPRIHLEKEVTLDVEIKVSSLAGTSTVANIPIINTREIKNMIRLKDGETNLLAGLLWDEERKSISGISFLKDIPILGNLFSSTQTEIDQTDVILTITPHIIRTLPITDADARPFWVDPNSISDVSGAGQRAGEEEMSNPAGLAENQPAEPGEDTGANAIYLSPASFEIPKDREFRVNVELATEKELGNMSLNIGFDPQALQLKDVIEGGIAKQMGEKAQFVNIKTSSGCTLGFSGPNLGRGFKGQGILAVLVFTPVNAGETTVSIASYSAVGVNGQTAVLGTGNSRILIR